MYEDISIGAERIEDEVYGGGEMFKDVLVFHIVDGDDVVPFILGKKVLVQRRTHDGNNMCYGRLFDSALDYRFGFGGVDRPGDCGGWSEGVKSEEGRSSATVRGDFAES